MMAESPFNGIPGLCGAVWLQAKARGLRLSLQSVSSAPVLSVTQKRRCSCSIRLVALYKCYMLLSLPNQSQRDDLCRHRPHGLCCVNVFLLTSLWPQLGLAT